MTNTAVNQNHSKHEPEACSIVTFGFWMFILSDFILFATLFICYAVLRDSTFGSVNVTQTASLHYVLLQTLVLLTSCLSFGLAMSATYSGNKALTKLWLLITLIIGAVFAIMQYHVFAHLMTAGFTWQKSAFLSVYFTLLGMHWFHLLAGMLWIVLLLLQFTKQPISYRMKTRMACLNIFWVFLNILWLVIFTIVYLMGAIGHV